MHHHLDIIIARSAGRARRRSNNSQSRCNPLMGFRLLIIDYSELLLLLLLLCSIYRLLSSVTQENRKVERYCCCCCFSSLMKRLYRRRRGSAPMTRYMRRIMTRQMQRTDTKTSWIRVSALPSLYIYIYTVIYAAACWYILWVFCCFCCCWNIYNTCPRV